MKTKSIQELEEDNARLQNIIHVDSAKLKKLEATIEILIAAGVVNRTQFEKAREFAATIK